MTDYQALKKELDGIEVEDNPTLVRQKSRDFHWYSPILKAQLANVTGDLVVSPKTEEEVIRLLKVAYAHDVPVTARGTGTGNYGQAMPLAGGIVLNMAGMTRIKSIHPGRVVAEPGITLAKLDSSTKEHSGQELRFHPSTATTATLGGFIAGGSGGIGSITWGGLRDIGNILRLRMVTMESEPRVLDLTCWDLQKVSHAYGTNGIITEAEMPLAPAYEWIDLLVGFDDFLGAARFCDDLSHRNGILLKELAAVAAPIPYLRREQSVAVIMVAPHGIDPLAAVAAQRKREILYRSDAAGNAGNLSRIYELTWNHTTLWAMKQNPAFTYLQVLYPGPDHVEKVAGLMDILGEEAPPHLEFIRFDGSVQCTGLPLVRYSTPERLEEIIRLHEDNGCPVFNPHRYTLEEGGMKRTDVVQLDFKKMTDPKGLLNPGKMIAWNNPGFDFNSGKTYLFPGLSKTIGA
jgi:FAD/FMN-containing dehydrogenase